MTNFKFLWIFLMYHDILCFIPSFHKINLLMKVMIKIFKYLTGSYAPFQKKKKEKKRKRDFLPYPFRKYPNGYFLARKDKFRVRFSAHLWRGRKCLHEYNSNSLHPLMVEWVRFLGEKK